MPLSDSEVLLLVKRTILDPGSKPEHHWWCVAQTRRNFRSLWTALAVAFSKEEYDSIKQELRKRSYL